MYASHTASPTTEKLNSSDQDSTCPSIQLVGKVCMYCKMSLDRHQRSDYRILCTHARGRRHPDRDGSRNTSLPNAAKVRTGPCRMSVQTVASSSESFLRNATYSSVDDSHGSGFSKKSGSSCCAPASPSPTCSPSSREERSSGCDSQRPCAWVLISGSISMISVSGQSTYALQKLVSWIAEKP